jgi:hypothetical protein
MMKRTTISTIFALAIALTSCEAVAQSGPPVEPEIVHVAAEITAAESENAKYSGGLVKALIESRLATLRQTKAMLEQRRAASVFNISVRYTVDGTTLRLPPNAKEEIAAIEREIAATKIKVAAAQAEAAKYSGGLVLAMTLSNIATLQQTEAMLDQRRLALTFSLPQYLGFASQASAAPQTAAQVADEADNWEILDVDSKVTESNSTWWTYAWNVIGR